MATSGYIQKDTSFGYVKLSWSESSQDIANNKTTIAYTLSIYREYSISSSASKAYSIVFNGSTVASGTTTIGGSGTKTIKSGSVTIPHNADGTKTFSYSFSQEIEITFSGGWVGTVTDSGSGTLDTIPRATTPKLSASSVNYGAAVTISTPRASTAFTHTLRYSWNSSSGQIASGVATSYTWTVPLSFMNNIPNATASWGTIYCDTYNGSTLIGTKTIRLDTTVPSSVVPTFSSVTAVDTATFSNSGVTTNVLTYFGSYIQSISKPKFTANGAAGTYSSTISKYEFTFEGTTYSGNNYSMTSVIKGSGSITVTCKITDSRGRTATKTATLTVLAYKSPVVTVLSVDRANSDGTLNAMGTSAKITRTVTWNTLNAKNALTIVTKSRARGTSTWTTNNTTAAGTTGSYNTALTVSTFAATASYDFQIEFTDKFKTTIALAVLSTGVVTMSWSAEGVGIGKIWESGVLDVGGDINLQGSLNIGTGGKIKMPLNGWGSSASLDMNNGDIVNINSTFRADAATSDSEADQWAKDNTPAGSTVSTDYDSFRVYEGTGYLNGKPIFSSDSEVLWASTGYYMTGSHTVTPSKGIEKCPNGWVLVWSDYANGAPNNYHWVYTVVHKAHIDYASGAGIMFTVANDNSANTTKYIYVNPTTLVGNDANDDTSAQTNVVLRKVLSW